eukprot:Tamp_16370.p1 GENE.Tamp_16370~~Tamp_16370.p1  ORF type:complete len:313 (-),score=28.49 Tamp_16370:46-984(-)
MRSCCGSIPGPIGTPSSSARFLFDTRIKQGSLETQCGENGQGVCNLTQFDSRPSIALKSIYAAKPAGLPDAAYVSEKVWFYERLLGHTALLARARACIQSLRDAAIPEAVGSAEATGGEGRESGGGAMDGREASSRRRGGDVVDAGCEVDLGAGEEAGGSRGVRIGASSGRGAGVVGVHVRYTDNFHDRNKVENGLLTDIGEFVNGLRQGIAQVAARRGKSVRVLLCTDNPEVRVYLRERGVVCARPPIISRDKYAQALFEMMLLASCDLVVGSSSSTFSYESVFMNQGTNLMICNGGIWQTLHISGCGMRD